MRHSPTIGGTSFDSLQWSSRGLSFGLSEASIYLDNRGNISSLVLSKAHMWLHRRSVLIEMTDLADGDDDEMMVVMLT